MHTTFPFLWLLSLPFLRASVPICLLTATLPPSATIGLIEQLHLLPKVVKLIRSPTVCPNTVYSHFQLRCQSPGDISPRHFINDSGSRMTMEDFLTDYDKTIQTDDHILVFCTTRQDTEELGNLLNCGAYHALMDADVQAQTLNAWHRGSPSCILVSTSSLGAGVDWPSVRMVVHYKSPRNLLDYAQESGRGGRDGKLAYSVVFWDPEDSGIPLAPGQNPIGKNEIREWLLKE